MKELRSQSIPKYYNYYFIKEYWMKTGIVILGLLILLWHLDPVTDFVRRIGWVH